MAGKTASATVDPSFTDPSELEGEPLGEHRGKDIVDVTAKLTKTGHGFEEAMAIAQVQIPMGRRVMLLIPAVCTSHEYDFVTEGRGTDKKVTDDLVEAAVLEAEGVILLDPDEVMAVVTAHREKVAKLRVERASGPGAEGRAAPAVRCRRRRPAGSGRGRRGRRVTQLYVEYLPLDEVAPDERNPKAHRLDLLDGSFDEFGYTEPVTIDERTGKLLSGHGRLEQSIARRDAGLEQATGERGGAEDGVWTLPVTRGVATHNDAQAAAYLVAANKISEAGGWDDQRLMDLLRESAGGAAGGADRLHVPRQVGVDRGPHRAAQNPPAPPEGRVRGQYGVIVMCSDEGHQRDVYQRLMAEGLQCRVVVT